MRVCAALIARRDPRRARQAAAHVQPITARHSPEPGAVPQTARARSSGHGSSWRLAGSTARRRAPRCAAPGPPRQPYGTASRCGRTRVAPAGPRCCSRTPRGTACCRRGAGCSPCRNIVTSSAEAARPCPGCARARHRRRMRCSSSPSNVSSILALGERRGAATSSHGIAALSTTKRRSSSSTRSTSPVHVGTRACPSAAPRSTRRRRRRSAAA